MLFSRPSSVYLRSPLWKHQKSTLVIIALQNATSCDIVVIRRSVKETGRERVSVRHDRGWNSSSRLQLSSERSSRACLPKARCYGPIRGAMGLNSALGRGYLNFVYIKHSECTHGANLCDVRDGRNWSHRRKWMGVQRRRMSKYVLSFNMHSLWFKGSCLTARLTQIL